MPLGTVCLNGIERRECRRHTCAADHWRLTVTIGKASWSAQVRDLSANGLGLLFDVPVDADRLALVELYNPERQCSHLKAIRLLYSAPQPDGRCLVGASFLRSLTDEEIVAVLAGAARESRQAILADRRCQLDAAR